MSRERAERQTAPLLPLLPAPERYFTCRHCGGADFDDYMVHDSVWAEAGPGWDWPGCLHLACLEVRLRRRLELADFKPEPLINGWIAFVEDPTDPPAPGGRRDYSAARAGVGSLLYLTRDLPVPAAG